jgi:alkylation response protein AidB-like acyl-CoA dehydrogenase
MFRDIAHKFAEREMLPKLREYEVEGKYQHELIGKAAKMGLIAPHISQEFGGLGLDYLTPAVILRSCVGLVIVHTQFLRWSRSARVYYRKDSYSRAEAEVITADVSG